nr:hypothetical protein [uncultured Niameybacter sp.]
MSKMKYVGSILVLGMALLAPQAVYAGEIKPENKPAVAIKDNAQTSTPSSITFKKDEYVRITQSLENKEEIQTFDSQINIMGEARKGTNIEIIVYTGEKVDKPVATQTNNYKVYKLKEVGATQLFSQLIDLYEGENGTEGQNNVIIKYNYPPDEKSGSFYIKIIRKAEAEKEKIKSFIADDASGILGKIKEPITSPK